MLPKKNKKELIAILEELIRQKTVNPPGNEYLAAKIVKKRFEELKISYKTFEKQKGRTNILGYIGKGKPQLLIAAHLDVVPEGTGWKTPAFHPVLKGDKIYGRGACDNKGPLAAMLVLASRLKKVEAKLRGTVIIAALADEEKGSDLGMKYLINECKLKPDWAIIPDVGGYMKRVIIAEKGILEIKITAKGKQAHASTPEKGINAIEIICGFIKKLKKHKFKYKQHPLLKKPTLNIGMIKGGFAPNAVPGQCELEIDIRFLPSQKKEQIIREIKSLAPKNVKIQITQCTPPSQVKKESKLVKTLIKNLKAKGIKAECKGMGGVTVAKNLVLSGAEAIAFGPGGDDAAHISNEWISLKELQKFIEIMQSTILDLLK
ncbi:M20 family metallopeptidase [Candidatus Woesearchaeota archaeon]|nr:M20 family metallopeptidase [Candidatus Woesearchaeota archaeon]